MSKDTSVIPVGMYCYMVKTHDHCGIPHVSTIMCPYWDTDGHGNGHCAYLDLAGKKIDQHYKQCGVNMGDDE